METISEAIQAYRILIINNLFVSLLVIKLFSRFITKNTYTFSKEIIRWLVISSGIVSIAYALIDAALADEYALSARATGPYAMVYWLILFLSCGIPLLLLLNTLKNSGRAIFIIAFFINTGWLFERIVIIITSLHRDYLPSSWSMRGTFTPLISCLLRGICLAIFITAVSLVVNKYRKTNANDIKAL